MKPVLIGVVRFYQIVLSRPLHWLGGPGGGCRFTPTCSHYLLEAVQVHGAGRGTWLGLKRLLRCHPWGGHGCDPVPPAAASPREDSASSLSSPHQPPTHEHAEVRRDALTSLPTRRAPTREDSAASRSSVHPAGGGIDRTPNCSPHL